MDVRPDPLKKKLKELPGKPGVYLMKDAPGKVIYVGKAVNLKNRVRSYFQSSRGISPKTEALVAKIADFDYIVTSTEVEALLLENNLIKRHKPHYNILLKDDKTYPYIKVSVNEPFPRFSVTRKREADGARYYGPFAATSAMREVISLIRHMFPLRQCELDIRPGMSKRPCLNYQMGRCMAPCAGFVTVEEYRAVVDQAILLLEGRVDRLIREITADMRKASEDMLFEKAALLRDRIKSVELVGAMQKIVMEPGDDTDAIGVSRHLTDTCVAVIMIRDGRVNGKAHFFMEGASDAPDSELLAAFLKQYYMDATSVPPIVSMPVAPDEARQIEEWLTGVNSGRKVRFIYPKRGTKRDISEMARENAEEMLRLRLAEEERSRARTQGAVQALADALGLPSAPYRIECFDISNIQGTDTVASMVVFEDGLPQKNDYRRFRIRTVEGADDFKSMGEAVGRRFAKAREQDPKFAKLPGLLLIDGGKGQLGAALWAMRANGYDLPAAGLAKRNEELFLPDAEDPVVLPKDSFALHLVQRVRDEAHRFAITYHRSIRGKKSIKSELTDLPGIGKARLMALMKAFGSLAELSRQDEEAIRKVKGMDRNSAAAVWAHLRAKDPSAREEATEEARVHAEARDTASNDDQGGDADGERNED